MIQYLLSHLYIFTALTTVWLMVEFLIMGFFFYSDLHGMNIFSWLSTYLEHHQWNYISLISLYLMDFLQMPGVHDHLLLYIYIQATFKKLLISTLPTKTVETLVQYVRIFKNFQSCLILNKYQYSKLTAFQILKNIFSVCLKKLISEVGYFFFIQYKEDKQAFRGGLNFFFSFFQLYFLYI